MATYLIGDIQGCLKPLQRLLDKINYEPSSDRLWFSGDLVNRGGNSLEVLRLLHGLPGEVINVLGNHDMALLHEDALLKSGQSKNPEFRKILNAPDREELMLWLRHQPMAHWSKKHKVLLVHAGVIPQWSRKQAVSAAAELSKVLRSEDYREFFTHMYGDRPRRWLKKRGGWKRLRLICNILTRIRFCDQKGRIAFTQKGPPGSQSKGLMPWYDHPKRKTREITVAFGHWASLGLYLKPGLIGLDSGCVWGGKLSTVRLEDQKLIQVKGMK